MTLPLSPVVDGPPDKQKAFDEGAARWRAFLADLLEKGYLYIQLKWGDLEVSFAAHERNLPALHNIMATLMDKGTVVFLESQKKEKEEQEGYHSNVNGADPAYG